MIERPNLWSADQCDRVLALAARYPSGPATVRGSAGDASDPRVRSATTTPVPLDADSAWLYAVLADVLADAGAALGIKVGAIDAPVQVVRYDAGDHFQQWHSDAGTDLVGRRALSASIELSDAADYTGGALQIAPDRMSERPLPRGTLTAFPSRALHRVTPVTRGCRQALVVWAAARD